MSKKIICTVTTDPNYDQRMQRICTALSEAGYDVTLIGRILPHSVELNKRNYTQKRFNLFFKKSFCFYAEYNIRLFFYLLFHKFDMVCSVDLDSILPGWIVSRLKHKVFIHDAHELFSEMPELDQKPLSKKMWRGIEQYVFSRMKHAYTVSKGFQQIYNTTYPTANFSVIRNVPCYYQTKRNIDDGEYILYQGALNVGRGLESAIKAIKEIDYELWLAGEGEISQELRMLAEKEGVAHKVKFLGMLTPYELKKVTKQAKIGLNLLTPNNLHYQLTFPNKLFDYIMAELPQIGMNFSKYQQIIDGDTIGILINDLDVETVKNAIVELLNNTELYKKSMEGCTRLKEIHHWENEKQKLFQIYQKIEAEEWS